MPTDHPPVAVAKLWLAIVTARSSACALAREGNSGEFHDAKVAAARQLVWLRDTQDLERAFAGLTGYLPVQLELDVWLGTPPAAPEDFDAIAAIDNRELWVLLPVATVKKLQAEALYRQLLQTVRKLNGPKQAATLVAHRCAARRHHILRELTQTLRAAQCLVPQPR